MKKVTLSIKRLAARAHHFVVRLPDSLKRVRFRLSEITWARRLRKSVRGMRGRNQVERNIWYLYVEMFWAAIFMAAMAFNATYALRLGASNALIGWMSSFPALLAMITMVPAARFLGL